jgi:4-hydroxybenzoate polyprenyltransferase
LQLLERPEQSAALKEVDVPLCVDLDGTLARTDLFLETAIHAIREDWVNLFRVPAWILLGRAAAKEKLARIGPVDPATLPYHGNLIDFLRAERTKGRKIVLATASDRNIAEQIARHLDLFDDVVASDGARNMKGPAKADALAALFGERGFTYIGNSRSDLPVWRRAKSAILVNARPSVAKAAAGLSRVERHFRDAKPVFREILREARPHQWLKNLLVFVSPLAAHAMLKPPVVLGAFVTFAAFCAAASGIYILNDLYDLESDRRHPWKRFRPFAVGDLPLQYGVMGPFLVVVALGLALAVSLEVMLVVYLYVTLSLSYSQYLKTRPLVDVFCLALLYTLRMFAGGIASRTGVSIWLLNFSGFLFLSLGFLKRHVEFPLNPNGDKGVVPGRRGYQEDDSPLLLIMGVCSSFLATVVFAFYVNSTQGHLSFRTPYLLWGIVPLILFWQLRLWLATIRGYMHDDPVVYAAKDNVSRLVLVLTFLIYVLASLDVHAIVSEMFPGYG